MVENLHTPVAPTAMKTVTGHTSGADVTKVLVFLSIEELVLLDVLFVQDLDGVCGVDFAGDDPQTSSGPEY